MTALPIVDDPQHVAWVYERAVALLDEDGWCQGAVEQDGKRCAVGALREVEFGWPAGPSDDDRQDDEPTEADDAALIEPLASYLEDVPENWNDRQGRQYAEVRAALLGVASHYRGGGR